MGRPLSGYDKLSPMVILYLNHSTESCIKVL